MAKEVDQLWLGGYSTGANLVTSEAYRNENIKGLLLFSPAYQPTSKIVKFAPLANWFVDWVDMDPETNITRYDSLPMNGAAIYYRTSQIVRKDLQKPFEKPVLMVLSEKDSVVDSATTSAYFHLSFHHPDSQLIWYGESPPAGNRVRSYSMDLPSQRISSGSHMGPLFSPNNPRYGRTGHTRICNNGQPEEWETLCQQGAEIWFSGWGYTVDNKIHARLTWNPYYDELKAQIKMIVKG